MIYSYVELSQIHLGNYAEYIGRLKEIVTDLESELDSKPSLHPVKTNNAKMVIKTTQFFLNILLDYAKRKNM